MNDRPTIASIPIQRGQYSEKVATRENTHVAADSAYSLHYAVGPRRDVFWRLTPRAAISATGPNRAGSHVRIARCKGLVSTFATVIPLSRPVTVEAVSPCLAK
jgi:hypothetical protein